MRTSSAPTPWAQARRAAVARIPGDTPACSRKAISGGSASRSCLDGVGPAAKLRVLRYKEAGLMKETGPDVTSQKRRPFIRFFMAKAKVILFIILNYLAFLPTGCSAQAQPP